ncbi:MAG: DUF4294 domain-containing protein [Prevotella sp.]|nr:DUF4294 domain-containing protein [Prevotella sp.]
MRLTITILLIAIAAALHAQDDGVQQTSPTFVPTMKVGKVLLDGDSVQYMELNKVYCYPPKQFKNDKERKRYTRMMYNVKKVLPIAKEVRHIMLETYEYMQTLPNKKARDEHLKRVERGVKEQYTPRMKKLTLTQGKLLIKLVYRECNSSGYDLINAFIGPLKAGLYQVFAWTFGASLKKTYDPLHNAEDADIERCARLVESGQM